MTIGRYSRVGKNPGFFEKPNPPGFFRVFVFHHNINVLINNKKHFSSKLIICNGCIVFYSIQYLFYYIIYILHIYYHSFFNLSLIDFCIECRYGRKVQDLLYTYNTTQLNSPAPSYLLCTQTDRHTDGRDDICFRFKNNKASTYTQTDPHTAEGELAFVSFKNDPAFIHTHSWDVIRFIQE